jgi:4-hydroxy-3-polyprenylbenzoate decarboxylase
VVGITGASGASYGIRALTALKTLNVETHLVVTLPGTATLHQELHIDQKNLQALATHVYDPQDFNAPIASGSFATGGMLIAPCSMKTLSAVAHSHSDNLLTRAADVTLKEGRPLLLMVRETPLHLGHLRLMVQAAEIGAILFPPVPAFYAHPATLEEMVDHTVGRMLARLGIANDLYTPWGV